MNRENIRQFSEKDAVAFEAYEQELEEFVKAIDPLLDTDAIDIRSTLCILPLRLVLIDEYNFRALKNASMIDKIKLLMQNWQLIQSAKILGPHAQAFFELMTAPTAKILDKWWEKRQSCHRFTNILGLSRSP